MHVQLFYFWIAVVETLLKAGADVLARNEGGLTALMMVKEKFYVDCINLLHEAGHDAGVGVGEGSCATKNAPNSRVVTFLKPAARSPKARRDLCLGANACSGQARNFPFPERAMRPCA